MNRAQWACGLLIASLLGCGRERLVYEDEDRDPPIRTYVLSTMDDSDPSVGFDLDGVVSEGATGACSDQPDFASGGRTGIDNRLAANRRVGLDPPVYLAELIEPQIAAGEYLLLMELTDVDSTGNDVSVGVRLYLGSAAGPIALEEGLIAPGQTFQQVGADLANVAAVIVDGMLTFEVPRLPLGFPPGPTGELVTLHDVRVEARLDPGGRYMTGVIGGSIPADEVAAYTDMTLEELEPATLFDLEPDPSDDRICGAMSAGLSFEAVHSVPE